MSVVFVDRYQGIPLLFGDILISRVDIRDKNAPVPSLPIEMIDLIGSEKGTISGYMQKIICLRDDVAIGWTGSVRGARIACEVLNRYLPPDGTDYNYLVSTIGCTVLDDNDRTVMLICVRGAVDKCYQWDSKDFQTVEEIEPPFAIGSGADHVKAMLRAPELAHEGDLIGSALARAAGLISYELAYGLNLRDLWGGAIQTVLFHENRFQSYVDYILLFFYFREWNNMDFQGTLHPYIFRPMLFGRNFIIQRMDWHKKKADYFPAKHILEEHSDLSSFRPMTTQPRYYCFAGIFHHKDGGDSPLALVLPHQDAGDYFRFEYTNTGFEMSFSNRLWRLLVEIAKTIQNFPNRRS